MKAIWDEEAAKMLLHILPQATYHDDAAIYGAPDALRRLGEALIAAARSGEPQTDGGQAMTKTPTAEDVERLAQHYDERVEQHARLVDGPAGVLRTERGRKTAELHRTTADALRALSARVAELERERDEARARAAAAYSTVVSITNSCIYHDSPGTGFDEATFEDRIDALATDAERDALAERDARIRRVAYVKGWNDAKPDAPFDLTRTWDAEEVAYRLAAIRERED